MSSRRKTNSKSTSTLQKNLSLLKDLNKHMALSMQRLKEDLSKTISQNLSIKGELYETLVDRNCLLEKNRKLSDLLWTLQVECSNFGKRVEDILDTRDSSSSTLNVKTPSRGVSARTNLHTPDECLSNIHNVGHCTMQRERIIRNNNCEPGMLHSRKSTGAMYNHFQDTCNLSPITEEQCDDIVTSRLGRRSRLTQNIAQVRISGAEEELCSVRCSMKEKLSACNVFHNMYELEEFPVNIYQSSNANKDAIGKETLLERRDSAVENTKSIEESVSTRARSSMLERSSLAAGRNSSLLTINIMQPQASPPVFVNIRPRRRRYASKLSLNDGFLDIGLSEENAKTEDLINTSTIDSKIPKVVLERLPLFEKPRSSISNEGGTDETFDKSPVVKEEKGKSTRNSWRTSVTKGRNSCNTQIRKSIRIRDSFNNDK